MHVLCLETGKYCDELNKEKVYLVRELYLPNFLLGCRSAFYRRCRAEMSVCVSSEISLKFRYSWIIVARKENQIRENRAVFLVDGRSTWDSELLSHPWCKKVSKHKNRSFPQRDWNLWNQQIRTINSLRQAATWTDNETVGTQGICTRVVRDNETRLPHDRYERECVCARVHVGV